MHYQFAIPATVTLDIEAEDLDAARKKWGLFCYRVEADNSVSSEGGESFYLSLTDEEPSVYDAERGEVT